MSKRARQESAAERLLLDELTEHVNRSASTLGKALRLSQKAGDDDAVAAARQERLRKSAGVFQGDAGLAAGLDKMRQQISALDERIKTLVAAIAMPLPTGEVMVAGQPLSLEAATVRATHLREEQARLKSAVSVVGAHAPTMLKTLRQLAKDGDIRGEMAPPRGSRPKGLIYSDEPEDVIVHHYVGERCAAPLRSRA